MADPLRSKRHFITRLRRPISWWMRRATNYKVMNPPPDNRGNPFLLISNHVSIYDLAYALLQLNEMPVIVIHEIFQRNPVMAWLLRPLGLIWKQADLHDGKSIRQMKRAASAGRSILLFPEGDLTWDGDTGELPEAIVKLIRYIGLPVVVMTEKGAYMTYSRWAGEVRKGLVELHFKPCISAEDLDMLDDTEILQRLRAAFRHSERKWLYEAGSGIEYSSGAQAKDLSKLLFLCPRCKCPSGITNSEAQVSCSACGFSSQIGPRLELDRDAALEVGLKDIWDWHAWQAETWRGLVDGALAESSFHLGGRLEKAELVRAVGAVKRIVTKAGFHSRLLKRPEKSEALEATISPDGLKVIGSGGDELLHIPLSRMLSIRVLPMRNYLPNWLLISTQEGYYKLIFKGPGHPAYCWCSALRHMTGQQDACPHLEE